MVRARLIGMLIGCTVGAAAASHAQTPSRIADRYITRAWSTNHGLPQNTVTAIAQTQDGYLWLGTFGGLVRFDGQAFTVFHPGNTPGLASARITALFEAASGALWVGTEVGLARYDAGTFRTYTTGDGLPHNEIYSIAEDGHGLLIGTGGGLCRYDGRVFSRVPLADASGAPIEGPGMVPVSLAVDAHRDVWLGTWDRLARLHDRTMARSLHVTDHAVRVLVDHAGRLWSGSRALSRRDGDRFIDVPLPMSPARYRVVSALAAGPDGSIWIGTFGGGVFRWRDGIVDGYSTADGLTNDVVRSLLVDRGGQVWIGTDTGGLTRLKPRRAHNFPLPGRADASIGPIVDDGDGGLWVGATCGGLLHFREGAFRVYDRSAGLPHECVWALHRDPDGTLWIGTMGGGLARLRHGVFSTFNASPATALVHAIKRDRAGRLWVGANNGLNLFDNGRFTTFVPDPAFPDVSTIAEDHTGALWLGGRHGVRRFKDGRVTATYTTADGLSHNQVRAIHEDADGALWIGTYGGGLNRLQDGHITTYGLDEGLPDVAVSRIIEDERGDLWMSGNRGVYRVARRQLNDLAAGRITKVTSVTYGTADGMVIEETNGGQPAGWRTADGHFWFPTIKGLVRIDAGPTAAPRPPTFIERASVNGAEVAVAALGALGPGRTDAEIHFTAVDLGAAEKTRFRYRLHPYDPDWIQAGTRRVAYYTQIPPGRYRFEVEATDSDGAWSGAPAVVPLVVVPRWWQRLELQTAGALALLAATGFGARAVSLRRARARFSALERERALDRERTRIARDLHDELGSQLTRIALIASRGDGEQRSPVAQAVQDAVRTMGELVWSVDARRDSVDSFATYAAQFAEQHLEAAGIRCRLNIDPDLGDRELHADMRRNLFLAFKEALNNAVRHARASQVTVTIASTGDVLTVAVTDDGRGLPGQADGTREDGSRGNGLDNMRARIESLGGDVRLGAPPGGGTQVTFRLFLRQPRSSHPKM